MAHSPKKMPPKSRLEINFLRVFATTLQMASGKRPKDWTFEKQVEWLEKTLPDLEKSPCPPSRDTVNSYRRQVRLLKEAMDSGEDSTTHGNIINKNGHEYIIHNNSACGSYVKVDGNTVYTNSKQLEEENLITSNASTEGSVLGTQTTGSASSSPVVGRNKDDNEETNILTTTVTQQIQHRTKASKTTRLRRQLLGNDVDESCNELSNEGYDERLASDERKREKLLENMITMTQQLKQQSQVVGNIAKSDKQILSDSGGLADSNQERLQKEADRLSVFNKRACNCWIWLMLLLVCFAFISMVMFIKLFPKRYYEQV